MDGAATCRIALVFDRRLTRDEQLQEVVQPVERIWIERVDVRAVGEREPLVFGAGEVLRQVGAVAAGLLVLPLACHERRNVDVVNERDRVQRVGHRTGCTSRFL